MHPAYSVIFFTVSSGLGLGLAIIAGLLALFGWLPADGGLALAAMGLALVAVAAGLFSSTLHLGHPERAWRAFSQWRTSWLSREGVLAVAVFPPALVFAFGWAFRGIAAPYVAAGVLAALLAFATVVATGMIYQSLPTVRAWSQPLVTPAYVVLALATGSLWLAALTRAFGHDTPQITQLPFVTVLAAWVVKAVYWRRLDRAAPGSTPATATGLGGDGARVRLLEAPHTQENFVMREMGYRVARRHARRLRHWVRGLGFFIPLVLTEAAVLLAGPLPALAAAVAFAAAVVGTLGVLIERWLFFAEARHVVTLYYGASRA